MKPLDQRTVQAIHSGEASCADRMTSPSFSRFSSSATMTGRPARSASRASGIVERLIAEPPSFDGCWRSESGLAERGCGRSRERKQTLHVARQDVGLEVDVVAGGEAAEGRRLERLGDERHLEPLAVAV